MTDSTLSFESSFCIICGLVSFESHIDVIIIQAPEADTGSTVRELSVMSSTSQDES